VELVDVPAPAEKALTVLLGPTSEMGYLDSSFADGGVVLTNVGAVVNFDGFERVADLTVDGDGNIVLVGDALVVRLGW
jgi:hypothetical protein